MKRTEKEAKLNLYQKLVLIRKAVPYLKKEETGHRYVYASESQILGAIRDKMDELGVLLYQDFIEAIPHQKGLMFKIEYTWLDAEDPSQRVTTRQYMSENGFDAKTIGAIMTYSQKYFLFKFLNVPMDKEDPDVFQAKQEARKKSNDKLGQDQVMFITNMIPKDRFNELYQHITGHYTVESLSDIPATEYDLIINEINNQIQTGVSNG